MNIFVKHILRYVNIYDIHGSAARNRAAVRRVSIMFINVNTCVNSHVQHMYVYLNIYYIFGTLARNRAAGRVVERSFEYVCIAHICWCMFAYLTYIVYVDIYSYISVWAVARCKAYVDICECMWIHMYDTRWHMYMYDMYVGHQQEIVPLAEEVLVLWYIWVVALCKVYFDIYEYICITYVDTCIYMTCMWDISKKSCRCRRGCMVSWLVWAVAQCKKLKWRAARRYTTIHICNRYAYTIGMRRCVHVFVQQLEKECDTQKGQNIFCVIFDLYFYSMDMNRYINMSMQIIEKDCEAQVT